MSKSLDLFNSHEKDNRLTNKSSKKQFATERQKTSRVDEGNKKKVFPKYLNQQTLVAFKTSTNHKQEAIRTTIKVDVSNIIY